MSLHPADFQYKKPPYEYEYNRLPMDLILGDTKVREALEKGEDIMDIENLWQNDLEDFIKLRQDVFLYN
jgi:uncharacterized protein YbbC (DUF1343 family)